MLSLRWLSLSRLRSIAAITDLTGCVVTSATGLDLHTSNGKIYSLEGDAASIKAGDKVKLHGTRIKKAKDSTGPGVLQSREAESQLRRMPGCTYNSFCSRIR